jgi:hypothetical protein
MLHKAIFRDRDANHIRNQHKRDECHVRKLIRHYRRCYCAATCATTTHTPTSFGSATHINSRHQQHQGKTLQANAGPHQWCTYHTRCGSTAGHSNQPQKKCHNCCTKCEKNYDKQQIQLKPPNYCVRIEYSASNALRVARSGDLAGGPILVLANFSPHLKRCHRNFG